MRGGGRGHEGLEWDSACDIILLKGFQQLCAVVRVVLYGLSICFKCRHLLESIYDTLGKHRGI